jgi:PAS domain S-box-containing protein
LAFGVAQDITERKRFERALQESEERYRAVFEQSADRIVVFDPAANQIVDFNHVAFEQLGYSREEFSALDPGDIEVSRDVEQDMEMLLRGGAATFESKHRTKSGELRDVLVNVKGVTIGGRPMALGVAHDITERKQSETALQESEERYRAIFEQSSDSIVLWDPETGDFVDFNRHAHEHLGYTREEFGKLRPEDIEAVVDAEQISKATRQLLRKGRESVFESKHRAKSGELRDIVARGGFVTVAGRTLALAASRDVTDQKRAERERSQIEIRLRHAQKLEALGEVAAGVAHEFNNLLVGVVGNAELLIRKGELASQGEFRRPVEDILRSGSRAAALTDQLLAFSQKKKPKVTLVDMNQVIARAEGVIERLVGKRKTVESVLTEDLWQIRVDEGEMEQLIMYLTMREGTRDRLLKAAPM